jgi:hypothetical protein
LIAKPGTYFCGIRAGAESGAARFTAFARFARKNR